MFDHYIGLDWAQRNMALARMTGASNKITTINVPSDIRELRLYLSQLKGSKVLTFEETTTSQWLYTELRPYVSEVVVCDPYRNRLLSEGPKTDCIDAQKLVQLLRGGMLKAVFHSGDEFIRLRKLVSGYQDVIKAGVRLKNQRCALFRAVGEKQKGGELKDPMELFVLEGLDRGIESYELERGRYEGEFHKALARHSLIRNLRTIPGIGLIGAVKLAAQVVDITRFPSDGRWLSYVGLVKLELLSGGRSYGRRSSRYCRMLKSVFKTAALSAISHQNVLRDYYEFLLKQGRAEHNARHAVARRIARIAFGVFRSKKPFDPGRLCVAKKV